MPRVRPAYQLPSGDMKHSLISGMEGKAVLVERTVSLFVTLPALSRVTLMMRGVLAVRLAEVERAALAPGGPVAAVVDLDLRGAVVDALDAHDVDLPHVEAVVVRAPRELGLGVGHPLAVRADLAADVLSRGQGTDVGLVGQGHAVDLAAGRLALVAFGPDQVAFGQGLGGAGSGDQQGGEDSDGIHDRGVDLRPAKCRLVSFGCKHAPPLYSKDRATVEMIEVMGPR